MKQKNRCKTSIKWKIFYSLIGFTAVLLVLLFLFQVVFLGDFYQMVKVRQTKHTANEIMKSIKNGDVSEQVSKITADSDYCIRVGIVSDGNYRFVEQDSKNKGICGYQERNVASLYQEAKENNGKVLSYGDVLHIVSDSEYNGPLIVDEKSGTMQPKKNEDTPKTLTYGIIEEIHGAEYFVLVDTRVTIVNEIANTIYIQLLMIMSIVVVMSLILGFLLSNYISKPIIKINKSAKQLATGDFDVHFEGKGYLEIEELNDTLNYASHELSKVEKLRNELIANMSHDLRTPLTMIAGYGEVMRDLPGENTPENVQVIIDECHRLTTLVNDILDLSKLSSGTQTLQKECFNITQLVNDIMKRFSTLLKKDEYDISFIYDQEAFVYADEIKINQVIYNMVVNAVHYTGSDHKVHVKQIIHDGKVRIEVSDSGEGIKEEDLPYVWERYYKLDKNHRRTQIGSGLGLSIVKGILELHEAHYGVVSKMNVGTTFYFELAQINKE